MSLAASVRRRTRNAGSFTRRIVKSGVQTYIGGAYAVELATGFIYRPVGNTAAEQFAGWATQEVLGDGKQFCQFSDDCEIELVVTGVTGPKDEGKTVFATDDGTFSLTDSGSDLPVGRVSEHVTGTTCFVRSKRLAES